MHHISDRLHSPLRLVLASAVVYVALIVSLTLTARLAAAQSPDSPPSAPEPQIPPVQWLVQNSPGLPLLVPAQDGYARNATDMSTVDHDPQDAPVVAMAPHPEDSRYWLSGQANIILQGNLPFHSPYQGTNSFLSRGAYKTSLLGTFYTAFRPTHSIRYNNDLILDIESTGGRGLSEALGLAGATNLDVVRDPNLSSVPYLSHYEIHHAVENKCNKFCTSRVSQSISFMSCRKCRE